MKEINNKIKNESRRVGAREREREMGERVDEEGCSMVVSLKEGVRGSSETTRRKGCKRAALTRGVGGSLGSLPSDASCRLRHRVPTCQGPRQGTSEDTVRAVSRPYARARGPRGGGGVGSLPHTRRSRPGTAHARTYTRAVLATHSSVHSSSSRPHAPTGQPVACGLWWPSVRNGTTCGEKEGRRGAAHLCAHKSTVHAYTHT